MEIQSLCKLEVQSIFAILATNVFVTQSKMYDEAFLKKYIKSFSRLSFWQKSAIIDVQEGSKCFLK